MLLVKSLGGITIITIILSLVCITLMTSIKESTFYILSPSLHTYISMYRIDIGIAGARQNLWVHIHMKKIVHSLNFSLCGAAYLRPENSRERGSYIDNQTVITPVQVPGTIVPCPPAAADHCARCAEARGNTNSFCGHNGARSQD